MSMFGGMEISASALTAQRLRMNVTAENLANAETTKTADGTPYRRKEVTLEAVARQGGLRRPAEQGDGRRLGCRARRRPGHGDHRGPTDGKLVYDPSHPDANAQGYVRMPNVDTVTEMVDLIDAQRAYEANVTAMSASKQMFAKTLEILR